MEEEIGQRASPSTVAETRRITGLGKTLPMKFQRCNYPQPNLPNTGLLRISFVNQPYMPYIWLDFRISNRIPQIETGFKAQPITLQ